VAIRQIEMQQCIPIKIEAVATGRKQRLKMKDRFASSRNSRDYGAAGRFRDATARHHCGAGITQNLRIPHDSCLCSRATWPLLQAGMTLDEGCRSWRNVFKQPRVQLLTRTCIRLLVDGRSFSQALRDFPRFFSRST